MTNPLDPWKSLIEQLKVIRPGPKSNLPPETHLSLESYLMQEKNDPLLLSHIIEAGKLQKKQGFLRKFNRIASQKQLESYTLMRDSPEPNNQPYGLPSSAEEEYERSCKSIAQETFRQLANDYGWLNLQGKSLEHALLQEGVPLALFNRLTYCEEDIPTMLSTIRRKVLIETPPERNVDKLRDEYLERFHVYDLNGKDLGECGGRLFVEIAYFGQVTVSNSFRNLWDSILVNNSLVQREKDSKKIKDLKNKEFNLIWDSIVYPAPLSTAEKREIKKRFPDADERIYNGPGYEFIRMVPANIELVDLLTSNTFVVEKKEVHPLGRNFIDHATYLSKRLNDFLNSNDINGIKVIIPLASQLSCHAPSSERYRNDVEFDEFVRDIFGVALEFADQNNNKSLLTHCFDHLNGTLLMNAYRDLETIKKIGKRYVYKTNSKDPGIDYYAFT